MAETTPPKPKKLSTRRVIYTVVIIVLLAANGGLVVKNLQTLREKKVISETLAITDSIKVELEIKVQEILAELATYEGKSYELDSLLNLANLEVSAKQQEIERLLDENATVHVLRRKVAEFNSVRNNLLAQIDSFSTIIEQLKSEKLTLQQTIESEKSYSQQLEEEKEILAKKVELGSIIGALNIISRGLREKGSGKFVTTTSAKKAMRFEICFDLAENKVADQGEKDIMLVIIGPNRKTLVDASHGSGKFTLSESGESKSYTTKTIVNYNNKSQHLCINWEQTDPFTAGNYKIEIYGSGYLMGISTMRLK